MAVVSEAVADVAEQVATEALEVADVARAFDSRAFSLGLLAGGVVGAVAAGFFVEKRLRGKYETLAESEIEGMREHFHAKVVALEGKPALDGLVRDLGYTAAGDSSAEGQTPSAPGEPNTTKGVTDAEEVGPQEVVPEALGQDSLAQAEVDRNVFQEAEDRLEEIDPDEGWDYDIEKANRSHDRPYVIHRDEQGENPGYTEATFTYYEADDVVCDAQDKIIDSREEVLGDFQDKFGHGSGDPNVVYIRNDSLGAVIEVCRSPNSFSEEVHGIKHSDEPEYRMPRRSRRDDE